MPLTDEQAVRLLRKNVDEWVRLGEPSSAEITTKKAEFDNLSQREQKKMLRRLEPFNLDEIDDEIEQVRQGSRSATNYIFYSLTNNQIAYGDTNTTVNFDLISANSEDALDSLGLTMTNGTFTSTKSNNLLLVSYQLMFDRTANAGDARQGQIVMGNMSLARTSMLSMRNRGSFVSACSPILLNRNDSFFIRAYITESQNVDLMANATRLSITSM